MVRHFVHHPVLFLSVDLAMLLIPKITHPGRQKNGRVQSIGGITLPEKKNFNARRKICTSATSFTTNSTSMTSLSEDAVSNSN